MKSVKILKGGIAAACAVMALSASAQTANSPSDSSGTKETIREHIDDAAITTKVKAALATEKGLKALHIHVKTQGGQVSLTGSVPTELQKSLAEETTKNVSGVVSVNNHLKVKAR